MRKLWVVLFVALSLYNCKSRKAVTVKRPIRTTERVVIKTEEPKIEKTAETPVVKTYASAVEQYIDTYKEVAKNEMRLYKIPASITMAQGILESGSGKGRLSIEANNHFGIKCHDWTGARIYHDDDRDQECFRKYVDAKYSYRDHSLFLSERRRYSGLFDLKPDDYKGWAKGLKAAGYATDRKYPTKLIALIERYELYKFDDEVLGTKRKRKEEDLQDIIEPIPSNTQVASIHIVEKGDTMYSLSKKYGVTVDDIKKLNSLSGTSLSIGQELKINGVIEEAVQQVVTVQTYYVERGDTLYSISKKHNTTVEALKSLNKLVGNELSIGQELRIK